MATVVNVPRDTRAAEFGAGLGSAVGGIFEQQARNRQRAELAQFVQTIQNSPDRKSALAAGMPSAFEGAQGALQYSSLIEAIHPRKQQDFVLPTDPNSSDPSTLEYLGRFNSGQQPEGAIPLDVAKLKFKVPTGRKGAKDTPTRLKAQVLRKMIANERSAATGGKPKFKLTSTESRLVQSEFNDPTWQAAIKMAMEGNEFFKIKGERKQFDFVQKIARLIENGGDLSKVIRFPPGVTQQDLSAIMKNPNQKGQTEDQILKQLWSKYDAGARF